jgi:hypothetical protein
MDQHNLYIHVNTELQKAFAYFNAQLCDNKLPDPILNIMSRGSRRTVLGWSFAGSWLHGEDKHHEITICAETLNRPIADVLETLLHEMAHYYNAHHDINDCNHQGRHNKKFKKTAEELFFLKVDKMGNKGWAYTSLTEVSQNLIDKACKELELKDFNLCRISNNKKSKAQFMINVEGSDKALFDAMKETEGLSSKEMFAEMLRQYQEHQEESNRVDDEDLVEA